jgi:hypothetical protein
MIVHILCIIMVTLAFASIYFGRCCCVQSRYRELVGVVNREDDPLVSMVEVYKQLPPQRWVAIYAHDK